MRERPADTLTKLAGRASLKNSEFGRRRILRSPSATADADLMMVRSGLAWLYRITSDGQIQVVALRFPGDLVLPDEQKSGYGVQALIASKIASVPAREFASAVSESDACRLLLPIIERQHRIALQWLIRGTFEAAGRVAHLLCEMAERSGHLQQRDASFSVPLSQDQIASVTGQTAVNVNRVLASFEREGVIGRTSPRCYTADWTALRQIGRFDSGCLVESFHPRGTAR